MAEVKKGSRITKLCDFGGSCSQIFKEKCDCGKIIEISSQKDEHPEYYTDIFVKCQECGKSIKFKLPVN